nr:PPE domain-containing protein [Kibdelosporangium sp. MJ126-NF4]CEL16019.1 hypothetical protein [Kibdelosporangium sp. MJ126-NF4]CTQ93944.1 hypothetical protein [Kibdelosporangium sp. MJ126-NF4]
MGDPNKLIAQQESPEDLAGLGLGESGPSLVEGIDNAAKGEWDALALSVDGASVALDVLGMVMNPLGEIVKAGVGWLLEHVECLREPLELLTGDPKAVDAVAQTWNNIAKEFAASADAYQQELSKTESWGGDGALAYRDTAKGYIGALDGIAKECENTASGVTVAGVVVGTVRGLIFDMIASFISRVITQALIAAATSVVSLGSSIAVFISSVLIDLGLLLAKIGKKLAKLIKGLSKFARKFADKSDNLKRAADKLSDRRQQLHNWADRTERQTRSGAAPTSGWGKKYNDYVDRMAETPAGKFAEHPGTKVAKEGAKSIKDRLNPGGGDEEDK